MKCQICNKESTDKYCDSCKHIRIIYVIHKLAEKISMNEKFNTNTLITKKLGNIEAYDLDLLTDYGLLEKDRLNTYRWSDIACINRYLDEHDKSGKSISITDESKEKLPSIDEVIFILEKNYNITDSFDIDELSASLNTTRNKTKKIAAKLFEENIIKKSFYGKYKLDFTQIIKYKESHKISEDKIKTISKIKKSNDKSISTNTKKMSKKSSTKTSQKSKTSTRTSQKSKKKKSSIKKENSHKTSSLPEIHSSKEAKLIPLIREYINSRLIILPHNVKDSDMTLKELYDEFKEYCEYDISQEDFNEYFHRTINTYPHIRHKKTDNNIQYNIKSRKTPQLVLEDLQDKTQKFTYNENIQVKLKENRLMLDASILKDELAVLYNLILYTHENIINYHYQIKEDKIHVKIVYDLSDESPELWIKFLKSYNLYSD